MIGGPDGRRRFHQDLKLARCGFEGLTGWHANRILDAVPSATTGDVEEAMIKTIEYIGKRDPAPTIADTLEVWTALSTLEALVRHDPTARDLHWLGCVKIYPDVLKGGRTGLRLDPATRERLEAAEAACRLVKWESVFDRLWIWLYNSHRDQIVAGQQLANMIAEWIADLEAKAAPIREARRLEQAKRDAEHATSEARRAEKYGCYRIVVP